MTQKIHISDENAAQKLKIRQAILVEGKYDKIKLARLVETDIFTTNGFSVFSTAEKGVMLRKIAEKQGIIILTDSDPAGFVIRNKLKGMLPKDKVLHLYAPAFLGKEARKAHPSKAGILGVEGLELSVLRRLFEKAGVVVDDSETDNIQQDRQIYTKADLYAAGLCGREESAACRDAFCKAHELPAGMTPNALLEAINVLGITLSGTGR